MRGGWSQGPPIRGHDGTKAGALRASRSAGVRDTCVVSGCPGPVREGGPPKRSRVSGTVVQVEVRPVSLHDTPSTVVE